MRWRIILRSNSAAVCALAGSAPLRGGTRTAPYSTGQPRIFASSWRPFVQPVFNNVSDSVRPPRNRPPSSANAQPPIGGCCACCAEPLVARNKSATSDLRARNKAQQERNSCRVTVAELLCPCFGDTTTSVISMGATRRNKTKAVGCSGGDSLGFSVA
jgi:hypothetical protein